MSRHLVRSFILATVLSPLVNAGPCHPPQISVSSVVESLTQSASLPSITSSSVLTETGLYSDTASEDTSTATFSTHDEPDYETATTSALSIVVILTTSETISSLAVSTDTYTAFSETETLTATTNDHLPTTMTDTSSTTSEPEPEPSCKDGFKNPLPEHTVCNLKGGATGDLTKIADGPGLVDGVEECRAACKELDGCDSFVLFSGQPCALFSGRPDFVSVVSSSSVTWFDMNCFCEEETTVPEPQPEPESSCKNSLKNPLPDAKICGKKGTATGGVQSLSTGDRGSLETCFKSCKNNPQCESVVWKQDLLCTLWSGRPLDVQASQADSEWYDIDCFCEQEIKEDEPSCKRSEDAVCGITGDALPTMQYYGEGPKDSLIKCADACSANDSCGFFMFEDKISCDMYTGLLSRTNGRVTYQKWYDATCFCGEEVRPLG